MIRVYTFADKRPDFIRLQDVCITRFLPSKDIKFTVLDNGSSPELSQRIKRHCSETRLAQYLPLPDTAKDHSNPNVACAVPLNWAWKNVIVPAHKDGDITIVLDSDMFPVAPFDPEIYLDTNIIAGTFQRRGNARYIWNGIMMFWLCHQNMDFGYGEVAGSITDVGGKTHEWFEKYGREGVKNIHHTSHIHPDNKNMHCIPDCLKDRYNPCFRMEIYADCFLHYGRGSNWDGMKEEYHTEKTNCLHMLITKALAACDNGRTVFEPHGFVFSENEWK